MRRSTLRPTLSLFALAAVLALPGCDNPACVFGPNGCRETTGGGPGGSGLGEFDAVYPGDATWLSPAPPQIVGFAPGNITVPSQAPIVVEFDQSLDPDSLSGAFQLIEQSQAFPAQLADPPALVGDGRVVILSPMGGLLPGGQYQLSFTSDQQISDVTGQGFDPGGSPVIGSFAVSIAAPPIVPSVLYTYPRNGETNASDLTEVTVVFDQPMDPSTFGPDSFSALVGGAAPVVPPLLTSLVLTGGQVPIPVTSVWRWSSVAPTGNRLTLGSDTRVEFTLSPASNPLSTPLIMGIGGDDLPEFTFEFDTSPLRSPGVVVKSAASRTTDTIGRPELEGGGGVVDVVLLDPAQAGDEIELFLFGGDTDGQGTVTVLQREFELSGGESVVPLGEAELDLLDTSGEARFGEGELQVYARLRRGALGTLALGSDADVLEPGSQRFVLDVTAPTIFGLGTSGSAVDAFVSQLEGVAVVGRASEPIGFVRVDAGMLGTNVDAMTMADPPEAAFGGASGVFVSAPVDAAPRVLDPASLPLTIQVEVFDRALNPATMTVTASYSQRGAVGPDSGGASVGVRVFDVDDGGLLQGATVFAHEENMGALAHLGTATTDSTGFASVPEAMTGSTVVTVQLNGYDSFTFHGVPTDRLDVPLVRSGTSLADVSGSVVAAPSIDVTNLQNRVADSRTPVPGALFMQALMCGLSTNGIDLTCPYGPMPIRALRLGTTTLMSVNTGVSQADAASVEDAFIKAWSYRGPERVPGYGQSESDADLVANNASDPRTRNRLVQPRNIDRTSAPSIVNLTVAPRASIEAVPTGIPGSTTVGAVAVFSSTINIDQWNLFGVEIGALGLPAGGMLPAIPGLEERRAVGPEIYVRGEFIDVDGNIAGAREPKSSGIFTLLPLDVADFLVPGVGGTTGGDAYNIEVEDVIAGDGLYRVTVTDAVGTRWHLWTLDGAGASVLLSVPPVGAAGGTALADGPQAARISAFSWDAFDRTRFLWRDLERVHELYSHSVALPFTQD